MKFEYAQDHPLVHSNDMVGELVGFQKEDREFIVELPVAPVGSKTHHVLLATDKGKLVGFFKFYFSGHTMYAEGTWVRKEYRQQNLAFRLWSRVLKKFNPTAVHATAVSKGGARLIGKISRRHPRIDWHLMSNTRWKIYGPRKARVISA